jgi:membrane protease YdiL (CAAX protease family)
MRLSDVEAVRLDNSTPSRPGFKVFPLILATLLALGLPLAAQQTVSVAAALWWPDIEPKRNLLAWLFVHHGVQAALALIAILAMKRIMVADFGLRLPWRFGDVAAAALGALAISVLFTLMRYLPNIVTGAPPSPDGFMASGGIDGWLVFEGLYVGPTEEILFRSLIIGYLAVAMPGVVRVGPIVASRAAVISALLFGLAHYGGVGAAAWWQVLFQMTYAVVLGFFYAYWFERTGSVVVTAVAHNITDLVATLTVFGVAALWH